jgi:hypothetical protein
MSTPGRQSGATCTLDVSGICVEFIWQGDRFGHLIRFRDGQVGIESLEGSPADCWPPSPPLQEIAPLTAGPTAAALLIGKAGGSHWSLSASTADGCRIEFDVACRLTSGEGNLGSSYRLPPSVETRLSARGATLIAPLWPAAIVVAITPHEPAELRYDGPNQLCISPRRAPGSLPRTVRWRYTVALAPPQTP